MRLLGECYNSKVIYSVLILPGALSAGYDNTRPQLRPIGIARWIRYQKGQMESLDLWIAHRVIQILSQRQHTHCWR